MFAHPYPLHSQQNVMLQSEHLEQECEDPRKGIQWKDGQGSLGSSCLLQSAPCQPGQLDTLNEVPLSNQEQNDRWQNENS